MSIKCLILLIAIIGTVVNLVNAKITMLKFENQVDPKYFEVKSSISSEDGKSVINVDSHCNFDGDDVLLTMAAYSKVEGVFNPFVQPDPFHICKMKDHEDPLIQFVHKEIDKYGNITQACPPKKGHYYYVHGFTLNEKDFPISLPIGEFRVDCNASIMEGGVEKIIASSELYFQTSP